MTEQSTEHLAQLSASKFVEVPEHHHWFWYMKNDSPWLELRNTKGAGTCKPYGEVRSWIEENANGKVFIQFGTSRNKEHNAGEPNVYDNRIIVLFDDPADYMAFKIVFPDLCRI